MIRLVICEANKWRAEYPYGRVLKVKPMFTKGDDH